MQQSLPEQSSLPLVVLTKYCMDVWREANLLLTKKNGGGGGRERREEKGKKNVATYLKINYLFM